MPHPTDLDLSPRDVAELASADAIAAFFAKLGYDTGGRTTLSPEAVGLSGDSANAIKRIETLSEDPEQFLRVVFAQWCSRCSKRSATPVFRLRNTAAGTSTAAP